MRLLTKKSKGTTKIMLTKIDFKRGNFPCKLHFVRLRLLVSVVSVALMYMQIWYE